MGLGLFEKLTGHFINGMPIEAVSKQTGESLSIMDHLQRLFNTKIGSAANKEYGFPATFADIHTKVPENVQEIEKAVVDTILTNDLRVKKVVVGSWGIEEKTSTLLCTVGLTLQSNGFCKFRILLGGIGNNRVEMWRER